MAKELSKLMDFRPSIKVLDATIRDGGLVNDFFFTDECVRDLYQTNLKAGVDYMELGYKADKELFVPTKFGKWKFCNDDDIRKVLGDTTGSPLKLAVMADVGRCNYKQDIIKKADSPIDMIRVATYANTIPTAVEMIEDAKEKGYEVTCNMAISANQESDIKVALDLLGKSNVDCIYIVDSYGSIYPEQMARIADVYMEAGKKYGKSIGIHAHNNMQQAFANATALCEHPWHRDLMLDASVMGIGRGAGNLCLELIEKYLCENFDGAYHAEFLYACADRHIRPIYEKTPWGYSIPYLLSAVNGRNPSYVARLKEAGLSYPQMEAVFKRMREQDVGIRFDPELCDRMIAEVVGRGA